MCLCQFLLQDEYTNQIHLAASPGRTTRLVMSPQCSVGSTGDWGLPQGSHTSTCGKGPPSQTWGPPLWRPHEGTRGEGRILESQPCTHTSRWKPVWHAVHAHDALQMSGAACGGAMCVCVCVCVCVCERERERERESVWLCRVPVCARMRTCVCVSTHKRFTP